MKKNHYELISGVCKIWKSKFLERMRIVALLILITVTQTFAVDSYGQSKRLSINLENETIINILEKIEGQSEFYFMFDASRINVNQRKSVDCENQIIQNILDELFENTGIEYSINDRQVLLTTAKSDTEQQQSVTGKVTEENGEPLPGVTVIIKGSTQGTITNADGNFVLTGVQENAVLVFSFVGMQTQEIRVSRTTSINVIMLEESIGIEEVVAIGYGVQRKEDATGAVQGINSEDFNNGVITSPEQLLTGKVAGLNITTNSGEPGGEIKVRLRGGTSINAGNSPLYVIDGVPIDNTPHNPGGFSGSRNPLNFINSNDIQDITVLKDASSTAIYGSRGANGVIIIRTKRGKMGKKGIASVNYNGYYSSNSVAKKYDVLNASEYRNAVQELAPERISSLGNSNTNWQDEIFRTAYNQSHDLSVTGGAENLSYRMSFGYQNQEGILLGTSTERISGTLTFNQNLFDNMLEVIGNVRVTRNNDDFSDTGNAIESAVRFDPTQPVYSSNKNKFGGYFEYEGDQYAPSNPVALLKMINEDANGNRSLGNIEFKYKLHFFPKISVKMNLAYDVSDGIRRRYIPLSAKGNAQNGTANGEIRKESYFRDSKLLESYINYDEEIKSLDSKLNFLVGYSYQDFKNEYASLRATELSSDILGYNSTSAASVFQANTSKDGNTLISFFSRLNYNISNKYLLTATLRADGSSRFSKSNQWGYFPSASLAWRISEEQFMINIDPQDVISNLKLRVSYGITGNQEIGNYQYLPTYTIGDSKSTVQFGEDFINTLRPNGVDTDLKWEETSQMNIGLDYGLFNNRISGTIDWYNKVTNDLLFEVAVAQPFLNTKALTNIGEVKNSGVEFTFDTYPIVNQEINWNLSFNMSYNKNEIVKLDNSNNPDFNGYETGGIRGGTGNNVQTLKVGESVNSFLLYEHILEKGKPVYKDTNGDGNIDLLDLYVDQNNDGTIDDDDKKINGSPDPNWLFGLSSMLTVKNLDFGFSLKASTSNYVYNNIASFNSLSFIRSASVPNNILESTRDIAFDSEQYYSNYFVEDASFLRLENVTIGYTYKFQNSRAKARLFVTGQNLFVLTDYTGNDPENAGIDTNLYPRAKTYLLGISLNF